MSSGVGHHRLHKPELDRNDSRLGRQESFQEEAVMMVVLSRPGLGMYGRAVTHDRVSESVKALIRSHVQEWQLTKQQFKAYIYIYIIFIQPLCLQVTLQTLLNNLCADPAL